MCRCGPTRTGLALLGLIILGTLSASAQQAPAQPPPAEGALPSDTEPTPAAQPRIVMPELRKFVEAPYPAEAEKLGLTAEVLLALTLDATGTVKEAEVLEPVGHGFDEAAREAALKFEFSPALRDGKPVAARVTYRYTFELKTVVEPPPPPPKDGNLGGVLKMAGTDVTLAGVEVIVRGADGAERRTRSDADGKWSVEGLPAGHYVVVIEAPGYQPVQSDEDVTAGEATEVTYRIAPESDQLEVTVQGERPPREVTRRTITREEIRRIPGTSGDALLSVQSLPGVARPPGLAGLIIVRGSAPQDTEVFVDGAIAPAIYHFGGLRSVIPTELLDRIDFYPGNFSARYGRVMGGIIDVAMREPDTRCFEPGMKPVEGGSKGCYHGLAQADLLDGRVLLQGPISKDWSFAVAGRRSWIDAWIGPVLESAGAGVTTAPVYYDYQGIAEYRPSTSTRLSLRFYGSDDRLKLVIKDPLASDPGFGGNITFGQSFINAQALLEQKLSPSVDLRSSLAVGKQSINFGLGNLTFQIDSYPIQTRSEFGWKLAKGATVNAGFDFVASPADIFVRLPRPPADGQPDSGPFSTRPPIERRQSLTVFRPAWYVEGEVQATERLRVVPGVRLDFAQDSGKADFSPRLMARYDVVNSKDEISGPGFRRTTLKGGVGLFQQPPQYQESDAVFGTPGVGSNRAMHYSLGVEQEFTREIQVSTEGFYKRLTELVSSVPVEGGTEYQNVGSGSVIGWETLLQYKPGGRFFGWLAYTLSRSVRQETPESPERMFEWDQTHNLVALGNYDLGRGWNFGARFRLVSGNWTTPVQRYPAVAAVYSADASSYTPLQGKPYSERLPLFHQLDVRIEKTWQYDVWRLMAYLDVLNAYNHASVEGVSYNYDFSKQVYGTGVPILPSVGLRGEF